MTQARAYRAYFSSTFLDNAERRRAAEDAVLRAGLVPVGMERFVSSGAPTVAECLALVKASDVVITIIGHRYGWVPDGETRSIAELEYDSAKAAGIPRLIFLLDPSVPVNPEADFDGGPDRWQKQEKLDAFRKRLAADQMPASFRGDDLGARILQALFTWKKDQESRVEPAPTPREDKAERVFVVHGRNREFMLDVALTVKRLGPEPIILTDQPNEGMTIIEKLEEYSKAAFAVVIMSADDEGRLRSEGDLSTRARQNVLVELGYFVGKLGRKRLCVLCEDGVERPSDLHGIVYTPLDHAGAWRLELARELRAAGLKVDPNSLL